jgi:hypothetical protein
MTCFYIEMNKITQGQVNTTQDSFLILHQGGLPILLYGMLCDATRQITCKDWISCVQISMCCQLCSNVKNGSI